MSSLPPTTFASLLRRYRLAAGLTQEELAERAHLSQEAIGTLERGTRRAPHKETVDMLAEALSLTEAERAAFEAAARQHRMTNPPAQTPFGPPAAQTTPPESPRLPEDGPAPSSGPVTPFEVVESAQPSSRSRLRRKLIAALVLLLLLGTGLLAGIHAFSGGGTLCLATDLPITYRFIPVKPLEDAINLAVRQNQHLGNGYTLKVINYDDGNPETLDYDPQIGAHNVQHMVQNPCIVGMVGPLNTDVAAAEMPIAANAGLTMISSSTTRSGLTLRPFAQLEGWDFDQLHPPGKPISFFRIAPNDVAQGLVTANFIFDVLGARTIFLVFDREQFGQDLIGSFTQSFSAKGGKIVRIDSSSENGTPSDIADLATSIAEINPDAVYYAGQAGVGGGLRAQLLQRGYAGPFVGSDGIAGDPGFVDVAGVNAANGTLAINSVAHPSPRSSDAAAQFFRDYSASYPDQQLNPYAAQFYDAAMVLITAIKHLISAGQPVTRAAMIEQVQHIQYTGVTGSISFDGNGDITHGVFSLYQVQNGIWTFVRQLST